MSTRGTLLLVDDLPQNIRLLEAVLAPRGYAIVKAESGREALEKVTAEPVDLVLLDILMPEMDGYAVCRALREDPATQYLPVVMVTASGDQEKVAAIEAGADDFVTKPFDQAELVARVSSLLRIKRYHDTIEAQAAELAEWNRELERRVTEQVEQLERLGRLRRFLSPQVAELVVSSGDDSILESHRREITVVFCDLRGFTAFAETVEPEDVMVVLARVPRGGRRPRPPLRGHARAVHGRRRRRLLQRPDPVRGRARSGRCGWPSRSARGSASSPRAGAARATTSSSGSASRRATRRSGGSASRAARTTRRSAA